MSDEPLGRERERVQARTSSRVGLALGPIAFAVILALPALGVESLTSPARSAAATAAWMAIWWVSEAAPLAVTSLLPLILLPLLGVESVREVAPRYGHHMVFLFLGGFVLALAVERSGLHRRLALGVLIRLGTSPRRLVWGFLGVTAGLSMWLSNTATTLMMLPIASGVAERVAEGPARMRLVLAVAYGASIGGIGTLIGTPPNLVLAGMAPELVPGLPALTFVGWMLLGIPLVAALLPVAGLLLARGLPGTTEGGAEASLRRERERLGRWSSRERRAAALFGVTALAWVTRSGLDLGSLEIPGWSALLSNPHLVSDAVPAILAAGLATLIPAGRGESGPLIRWRELEGQLPWGVLILFGGGFALAGAVHSSGLDQWLALRMEGLAALPGPLLVLAICLTAMAATELTSNTATATLLMPIMAALASALGESPYLLMVPAIVASSCAFMLPVATPPNAIVMASGHVPARDMVREGLRLNLAAAGVVTILIETLGRLVLPT